MKEFITAVEEVVREDNGEKIEEQNVEFKIDGRVLRAYQPTDGQLTFMLAALGRGQRQDQRFASIINIMMASLRDDDADYLEGRLLSRDPSVRIPVEKIEEIFEFLIEEWFGGKVTPPSSGSAESQPSDGQN